MGWSIGYDGTWKRDIGYGVPALCDHPDCSTELDRGLAHVCANQEPRGGEGCGLYFCDKHKGYFRDATPDHEQLTDCCQRCRYNKPPFAAKPDLPLWTKFKLADPSWAAWRAENNHPEPTAEQIAEIAKMEEGFLCS